MYTPRQSGPRMSFARICVFFQSQAEERSRTQTAGFRLRLAGIRLDLVTAERHLHTRPPDANESNRRETPDSSDYAQRYHSYTSSSTIKNTPWFLPR
jgi:hypothetical protein